MKPDDDPHDPDTPFTLYGPDGSANLVTPRDLIQRGMTLEDIRAQRYGETHYKHIHDIAETARQAGLPEAVIAEAIVPTRRFRMRE